MEFDLEPERVAFRDTVRAWVDDLYPKNRALELESKVYEFPRVLWDDMTEAGFHAIGIDPEYGGSGGDSVDTAILARGLSRNLGGLAWAWAISSFAGARAVATAGTDEQKKRLLPALAAGQCRFAIAVTEPGGGTDLLGAMTTRCEPVTEGWRISGQKMWSTGAQDADYLLLLARGGAAADAPRATTLFLVPARAEGIEYRPMPKFAMRAIASCEIFLDDVVVGGSQVLGIPGRGFQSILDALNNERILSAALALGMLDGILEEAAAYALERETFGRPIGAHQIIQHYLSDMVISQKQSELLTFDAAVREARGLPCDREAMIAKVAVSEHAVTAADMGIQILGGMGISLETHMQRFWRDLRQFRIAPISNEMARNSIAERLGMPRSFSGP